MPSRSNRPIHHRLPCRPNLSSPYRQATHRGIVGICNLNILYSQVILVILGRLVILFSPCILCISEGSQAILAIPGSLTVLVSMMPHAALGVIVSLFSLACRVSLVSRIALIRLACLFILGVLVVLVILFSSRSLVDIGCLFSLLILGSLVVLGCLSILFSLPIHVSLICSGLGMGAA